MRVAEPGAPSVIVLKLGGSVFAQADWLDRLRLLLQALRSESPTRQGLIVVGGGATADVVRDWAARDSLAEEEAHWLAIRAMQLNADLVCSQLKLPALVASRNAALAEWKKQDWCVLDPFGFLQMEEAAVPDEALPHVWDVTSDSLAAWIACRWPAEQLLLVKSCPCPTGQRLTEAGQRGLVDPLFAGIAGHIPRIRWCDLTAPRPTIAPWLEHGVPVEASK